METPKKHSKSGNAKNFGNKANSNGFKNRQPKPESKSGGWAKKKTGQELAKAFLQQQFKGLKDSQLRKQAAEYYNVPEEVITNELMILFRQGEKAISKSDTPAAKFVVERAHGQPKQEIETTGEQTIKIIREIIK